MEKQYHNRTVIVVDVLRATTCMVEALKNGASQVIPARDPGEAMAFAGHLGRKESLLTGERGGLRMPDFDLGNSPLEFTPQVVKNKTVVISTTNGTAAIHAARNAAHVYLGCMRNRTAVARAAAKHGQDITVLCAGTEGECSADDMVAAGAILHAISGGEESGLTFNDFARICMLTYTAWKKGETDLAVTTHYSRLKDLGFEEDLSFCFEEDQTGVVPRYENGSIRAIP
ncbi:MAG TPA: 2-phosphosulfolactate phosphatase [Feifaniaceae bacterium]|nr:2-phosphosulfolactate phosphatase [Feifaniaceae bacterium]